MMGCRWGILFHGLVFTRRSRAHGLRVRYFVGAIQITDMKQKYRVLKPAGLTEAQAKLMASILFYELKKKDDTRATTYTPLQGN